jgi:hypothetical protein
MKSIFYSALVLIHVSAIFMLLAPLRFFCRKQTPSNNGSIFWVILVHKTQMYLIWHYLPLASFAGLLDSSSGRRDPDPRKSRFHLRRKIQGEKCQPLCSDHRNRNIVKQVNTSICVFAYIFFRKYPNGCSFDKKYLCWKMDQFFS